MRGGTGEFWVCRGGAPQLQCARGCSLAITCNSAAVPAAPSFMVRFKEKNDSFVLLQARVEFISIQQVLTCAAAVDACHSGCLAYYTMQLHGTTKNCGMLHACTQPQHARRKHRAACTAQGRSMQPIGLLRLLSVLCLFTSTLSSLCSCPLAAAMRRSLCRHAA